MPRFFRCFLLFVFVALTTVSCTHADFDRIPRTDYIQHYQKCDNPHIPFVSYWSAMSNDEWDRMVEEKGRLQIYMPPVSLNWFEGMPRSARGQRHIEELREYFDSSIRNLIRELDAKNESFTLVDTPGPGVYTLDFAILCARPAKVLKNAELMAVEYLLSYEGIIADLLLSKKDDMGYIAMGSRFYDDKGNLLAEMADFEYGVEALPGYVVLDTKELRPYAYQHQTIDHWVKEFTEIYTTEHTTPIKRPTIYFSPF